MLHQPTQPHPYLESIDADKPITFSAVINPKDVVTSYVFQIYNANKEWLYDGKWKTPETPLLGTEKGTVITCVFPDDFTRPDGFTASSDTVQELINGEAYYWHLGINNGHSKDTERWSPFYYFTAKSSPEINFDNCENLITTCEHTFTATYSQKQSEQYMYYQYQLYKDNVLIDETPEKMDSVPIYTYSSFTPGRYRLDLTIMTSDRQSYTKSHIFDVQYDTQISTVYPFVAPDYDNNCIDIDFSQNIFIKGNTKENITYSTFKNEISGENIVCASIPSGGSIFYNKINEVKPINIGDDFTIYYHVHFNNLFTGNIIRLTDSETENIYNIRYDGRKFYYRINENPEVAIDPYVDENTIHSETSVIHESTATIEDLDYNSIYMLYENDKVSDDSIFMYNDITANFWWTFILLPNKVLIYKDTKDSVPESVVS